MPRPGPRPYECVRRAWHSERHQPMRGSIISQIFRVVTEAHSSTTRKNREWQEKLPTVVLKAEEIMYSKANSEAEYLDTDTLWDRLNDAIDTIIRKEETVETGEYLQPCIEAALVLGCVVVKASRSERLSNPRSYLHHHQDSAPRATALSDKLVHEKQPIHPSTSLAPNNQLSIARPTIQTANNGSRLQPNIEHNVMPTPVVYPLHYSTSCYQNSSSHAGIHIPSQNPSNIIVGTPVGWSSAQPAHLSTTRDLFPSMVGACSSDKPKQDFQADTSRIASTTGCDLSLSLGRNFNPSGTEGRFQCEYEVGGSGRFQEHNFDPKIRFLPRQSSDDYFEGELQDVSTIGRKRKLPNSRDTGEGSISQQPQRRPIEFLSQIRWPGAED